MRTPSQVRLPGSAPAIALLGILAMTACSEEAAVAPRDRMVSFDVTPAQAGAWHNTGLDSVLLEIQNHPNPSALNKDSLLHIAQVTLNHYLQNHGFGQLTSGQWNSVLAQVEAYYEEEEPTIGDTTLSSQAVSYLEEVFALTQTVNDAEELDDELTSLEDSANVELSGANLDAVIAVISIARSSGYYWEANYTTWMALCDDSPNACAQSHEDPGANAINGWKVLGADIFGGLFTASLLGALVASTIAIIVQA